ncbi:MAG TPA: hypothetical protein PLA01_00875, partial [Acetivibrio sp.]|nr:hypothetical protein [Acetivibrio sp.]
VSEYNSGIGILSNAVRNMGGEDYAQMYLSYLMPNSGYEDIATKHSISSDNSPFISVTKDMATAIQFSKQTGLFATISTNRKVFFNPFNVFGENEYLVPIVILFPEIISVSPAY